MKRRLAAGKAVSLSLADFKQEWATQQHFLIDTRPLVAFAQAHIQGAMNLPLEQPRADFTLGLQQLFYWRKTALLVVASEQRLEACQRLLAYCRWVGYLKGGFDTWLAAGEPCEAIQYVSPEDAARMIASGKASPLPPFAQS